AHALQAITDMIEDEG
ncbi:MAG: hypothetical protein ABF558_10620, partial [Gluconobacter sp.]